MVGVAGNLPRQVKVRNHGNLLNLNHGAITRKKWQANLLHPEVKKIQGILKLEAEIRLIIFTFSSSNTSHGEEKVYSIVRQVYGRSPTDDLNDLLENNAIWGIFMNVTLQAAVHLGRDYMENLRFTKNQLLKSRLFQVTEKLIKDQTEISGLTTIDYKEPTWKSTTLQCDKAIEITNAKTYVFADSVLCLGSISDQPVEAWKNKIKWYPENRHLKDLNRNDGEPVQRKDHLHVYAQRHCLVRSRKHRKMYYEFCYSCELCSQILARTLVIFGTWIREEMVRNFFWWTRWLLEQDCWTDDAQLCRKRPHYLSCHHRPVKRRIKEQRRRRRSLFTSTVVKKPLSWFLARLFL